MTDVLSWIRLPGPFLIGHRGYPSAARENTLASFEAALEAGCDGVELDARMTGDGVLVVHHDAEARRGGEAVRIEETGWGDLEGARFEGDRGPYVLERLDRVLESLAGRTLINVELKPPDSKRRGRVAAATVPLLARVRPRESLLVSSFDPDLLAVLRRLDRSLSLGFLFSSLRDLNHLGEHEIVDFLDALHPRHDLVDAGLVKRAGERGTPLHAWTVDDPAEAARLVALGVASVITNRPDRLGGAVAPALPPD